MDKRRKSSGICRRSFIKTMGMVAGAAAAYPLKVHAGVFFSRRPDITVGLISPHSGACPHLGENLANGLKYGFAHLGWNTAKVLPADTGADPGLAIARARETLEGEKVDFLAGFVNPLFYTQLQEALKKSGTPFINLEPGANVAPSAKTTPLIYHNSIGYWQANLALGAWAASRMGRRAFIATHLYESGYDSSYAFRQGFTGAGGQVVHDEVTHVQSAKPDLAPLMEAIRKAGPDFVYGMFFGQSAVDFVKAYERAGLAGQIPLVASPFMVEEKLLPAMGKAALGIRSCLTWTPGMASPENAVFRAGFAGYAGREADIFAVLGFETAGLIAESCRGGGSGKEGMLRNARIDGPRGIVSFDQQTLATDPRLHMTEVRNGPNGIANVCTERLTRISAVNGLKDRSLNGARSGWVNAYLCV